MASNKITEGVGKKIVDALKAQSDVEIHTFKEEDTVMENTISEIDFVHEEPIMTEDFSIEEDTPSFEEPVMDSSNFDFQMEEPTYQNVEIQAEPVQPKSPVMQNTINFNQPSMNTPETFNSEMEGFEIPTNVAVLKQLIAKLPSGVTKQTGAQIIRQTMEALGISMKSVLQEAQGVQEGLSNSSRECQATIMEYKRQIGILEKQAQKYQRQYTSLNDVISLFIQTNN